MQGHRHQARSEDVKAVIGLLWKWLARSLSPVETQWLASELDRVAVAATSDRLGIGLGLAGRRIARKSLQLDACDRAAAQNLRAGWQPEFWRADEAARVLLVLATHQGDDEALARRVSQLCAAAEVGEHVATLKGFAILPAPRLLYERAREGVRSSIEPVLEAIACRNPYPRDHFDEPAWNQMVLKCAFVGSPIDGIVGLRDRRNPELHTMLSDLVDERRSAGRRLPASVLDYLHD
jgi:hypothetical protein